MDYSVSGAFGEVKLYPGSIPTSRFQSIDHIRQSGWHRVNDLYRINRLYGSSDSLLLLTISGRGELHIGSRQYIATPGTIAVIPHDMYSAYNSIRGEIWEFDWVHYYGIHSDAITADIVKNNDYLFNMSLQEIDVMFRPFTENRTNEIDGELAEFEALYHILHGLLRRSAHIQHDQAQNHILYECMRIINQDNSTILSLEELSKECHYSKEYIIRTFKKATGMTPYHYHKLLVLKRSCDALIAGSQSIHEIAQICGYQNTSSYSTEFKKQFNISPLNYRKQYKIH